MLSSFISGLILDFLCPIFTMPFVYVLMKICDNKGTLLKKCLNFASHTILLNNTNTLHLCDFFSSKKCVIYLINVWNKRILGFSKMKVDKKKKLNQSPSSKQIYWQEPWQINHMRKVNQLGTANK